MPDYMKKFLLIAFVLAAFIIAGTAPARVRTIHHRVPHDPRPLHMHEGPSLHICRRSASSKTLGLCGR